VFASALSRSENRLLTLHLSANSRMGAAGTVALAASLPRTSITTLSLDGCFTGPSPCGKLAAALVKSRVESLDLSRCEAGDVGAWELAWRMTECDALGSLSLACNEIEDDGAAELLTALAASPSLKCLDLRGNRFDEKGATALALASRGANVRFQRAPPWRPPTA
jgi:Ran GTPase-activating protein (RanGAP) involved in mRNA processing and transport